MRTVFMTLIAAAVAGCAALTSPEPQTRQPARAGSVDGAYAALAPCVAEGLRNGPKGFFQSDIGNLTYIVSERASQGRSTVTGLQPGFPGGTGGLGIELSFIGEGAGRTRVEARTASPALVDGAWRVVERCSSLVVQGGSGRPALKP